MIINGWISGSRCIADAILDVEEIQWTAVGSHEMKVMVAAN